jgi:hypothetical protein
MAEQPDPSAKTIIYVGIVGTVAVFLTVIVLQIVFYQSQEMETYRKVISVAPEELQRLQAQQLAEINSYGWVDEGQGVTRVPIERAMELVVAEGERSGDPAEDERSGDPAEFETETETEWSGTPAETETERSGAPAETESESGPVSEGGTQ